MPRLTQADDSVVPVSGSTFTFSMVPLDKLSSDRYCLVTIVVDVTGSMGGHERDMETMLQETVRILRSPDNPMVDNTLLRVTLFSCALRGHVQEVHGFKLLADIHDDLYEGRIQCGGMTPLNDAAYASIQATVDAADLLCKDGYSVNGIGVVLSDGEDNESKMGGQAVKDAIARALSGETLESFRPILIGFNVAPGSSTSSALETWRAAAGFDQYAPFGSGPKDIKRLIGFVSKSISSQSKSLGSGGPSKAVDPNTLTI